MDVLAQNPSVRAAAPAGETGDEELLRRYTAKGDREALERLLTRHVDAAYRLARRYFPHSADAEDAVQSACLLVMRNAGQFRGGPSVRAWMLGHVVNVCRNKQREEARRTERQRRAATRAAMDEGDQEAVRREVCAAVRRAVEGLPELYRVPMWLHYYEGLDTEEVALALQTPHETVRKQLARAVEQLRATLAAAGHTVDARGMAALLSSLPVEHAPHALSASLVALVAGTVAAGAGSGAGAGTGALAAGKGSMASASLLGGTAMKVTAVVVLATAAATSAVVVSNQGKCEDTSRAAVAPKQERPTAGPDSPKGNDKAPLGSTEFYPSPERPLGWRGDNSGRFPGANPPSEWYRRPKGAYNLIRVLPGKPKGNGPEGEILNMGSVRGFLVAGPFEAKDHASALDDVSVPNETALTPAENDKLEGKPWAPMTISLSNQSQSWARLTLDLAMAYNLKEHQEWQNHPGTMPAQVAYASTNLFSPEACKVRIRVSGTKLKAWVNGNALKIPGQYEASPVVDLAAGWNRVLLKLASSKSNWNGSVIVLPDASTAYETKNIVWMAAMPGASWSSPIVVGEKIFIGADVGTLICLNKADGRVLWMRSTTYHHATTEEERKKFPDLAPKVQQLEAVTNELVTDLNAALSVDGSKADNNKALADKIKKKIDLERDIRGAMGKADKQYNYWENDRSTTTPTPVCDGKNVYIAFMGGNKGIGAHIIACYDLDGKNLWTQFTGQTGIAEHGSHSTPTLSGNHLVFASGRHVIGYDKNTGKMDWNKDKVDLGCAGASLIPIKCNGVDAVLVPEAGIFRSADGEELWNSTLRNAIVTPAYVNGTAYGIANGNNNSLSYYALAATSDKPNVLVKTPWKEIGLELPGTFTNSLVGSPLFDNGLVYVVSEGGGLTVLDAKTGKAVYTKALEALNPRLTWVFVVGICTGPTLAGKYIHIRDDQGQTLVIEPGSQYKEVAKNALWELNNDGNQREPQSNPFYEGGRMYYRSPGFLYCIGEK